MCVFSLSATKGWFGRRFRGGGKLTGGRACEGSERLNLSGGVARDQGRAKVSPPTGPSGVSYLPVGWHRWTHQRKPEQRGGGLSAKRLLLHPRSQGTFALFGLVWPICLRTTQLLTWRDGRHIFSPSSSTLNTCSMQTC